MQIYIFFGTIIPRRASIYFKYKIKYMYIHLIIRSDIYDYMMFTDGASDRLRSVRDTHTCKSVTHRKSMRLHIFILGEEVI